MELKIVKSDRAYLKMIDAPVGERDDIYIDELMMPFENMWRLMNIPMKSPVESGYDVIMATAMMGCVTSRDINDGYRDVIGKLNSESLWRASEKAIYDSIKIFEKEGFKPSINEINFSILLANPENPSIKMAKGYTGVGSMPGYMFVALYPNDYTIERLPLATAHEFNHQIRLMFEPWKVDITLGEYLIIEGLAEVFATNMFGKHLVGPWVSETSEETLKRIKPIFKENINVSGFDKISSYMYGDDLSMLQGKAGVGVPYCGGYAIGYHLIEYYLKKTGKTIERATLTPAEEILKASEEFWNE